MVATRDLKSLAVRRAGSSPAPSTKFNWKSVLTT